MKVLEDIDESVDKTKSNECVALPPWQNIISNPISISSVNSPSLSSL
jgi:hypothetical protein